MRNLPSIIGGKAVLSARQYHVNQKRGTDDIGKRHIWLADFRI